MYIYIYIRIFFLFNYLVMKFSHMYIWRQMSNPSIYLSIYLSIYQSIYLGSGTDHGQESDVRVS